MSEELMFIRNSDQFKEIFNNIDFQSLALLYDLKMKTKELAIQIPYIDFSVLGDNILVKILPPFMGAIVRFEVIRKDNQDKRVSVYLDWYNLLGKYGIENYNIPYWQVYSFDREEAVNFSFNEIDKVLNKIKEFLEL